MDSSIITGLFTLGGTLGGAWLNDHMANKKSTKLTVKQKALEAYTLTERLTNSLNAKQVLCTFMLKDDKFNYTEYYKNYPDTMSDDLAKLELLIVENFSDLDKALLDFQEILINQAQFLFKIIINKTNDKAFVTIGELEENIKQYRINVVKAGHALRKNLINQYINKIPPHFNVYTSLNRVIAFVKKAFEKPGT